MAAKIYTGTKRNVAKLARVVREGGLVAVPTETVYGLAANALDAKACKQIFRAKGRPPTDPLIVHVLGIRDAEKIAEVNQAARKLAQAFWPGPLTLVLPKRKIIPDVVTSGQASVAVRSPQHPLFRRLLKATGVPVAAPSANPFGYISPTQAEHVQNGLGQRISYILEGGPSRVGVESTIVDLRDPAKPVLLRPGAITQKQLEKVLKTSVRWRPRSLSKKQAASAPGTLKSHYSPRTPLKLHRRIVLKEALNSKQDEAWIFFDANPDRKRTNFFSLNARGEPARAAKQLFGILQKLDRQRFRQLHAEMAPRNGIGDAINDRLQRAAAKK